MHRIKTMTITSPNYSVDLHKDDSTCINVGADGGGGMFAILTPALLDELLPSLLTIQQEFHRRKHSEQAEKQRKMVEEKGYYRDECAAQPNYPIGYNALR